jgi:hypothetical protein
VFIGFNDVSGLIRATKEEIIEIIQKHPDDPPCILNGATPIFLFI